MIWVLFLCAVLVLGGMFNFMNQKKISATSLHHVYIAPRVEINGPAPVLILLHGVGSNFSC